ncbi:MAG: S8 family serine peptidase [Acidobacteria bacterium]|nr:S8 family serine peptidase [Acidobacteriota bacterium]
MKPPESSGLTGRGVRVAIIDSGVNPAHPHVGGVAGGIAISPAGDSSIYLDYLGHGTAVAGAIREKAPEAELFAVKVFDRALSTNIDTLLRAIEWCLARDMHVINLSLGTANPEHRARFEPAIERAAEAGVAVVAALEIAGQESLPGCLSSVIAVRLDWHCPRDAYRCEMAGSHPVFLASGYPRSIPGVSAERNLSGISFAVANMTGFVARARQVCQNGSLGELERLLTAGAMKEGRAPRA